MKVTIQNLEKAFTKDSKAVKDLNLVLESGELIALLGPSGCGKSTTLNMLAGILDATSGKILFDEEDVSDVQPQNRGVGLVFQNYALYPHMSVLENIAFPLYIQKVNKEERIKLAKQYAKLVQIDAYLDRKPKELSGGQQQRVAIARALIKKPKLLLLDEPLSNLDARLRLEMREEIRRIQQETKVTTVFVTHDQEEAMSICDHIALMKDGELVQYDTPYNLYHNPNCLFVSTFLGNPPINTISGEIKDGYFCFVGNKIKLQNVDNLNNVKVTLAIRCEAFKIDDDFDFQAKLSQRYSMGKEELAFVTIGNVNLRVYVSSDFNQEMGSIVNLKLKDKGVFIFDAESGKRLNG